jgi:hypothetical protein
VTPVPQNPHPFPAPGVQYGHPCYKILAAEWLRVYVCCWVCMKRSTSFYLFDSRICMRTRATSLYNSSLLFPYPSPRSSVSHVHGHPTGNLAGRIRLSLLTEQDGTVLLMSQFGGVSSGQITLLVKVCHPYNIPRIRILCTPFAMPKMSPRKNYEVSQFYRVLTMVYSTQSYWVFGISHRQVFLGVETDRFGKWICFRPRVEKKDLISITGPVSTCLLPPSHENGNRSSFENVVFLLPKSPDSGKFQKPSNRMRYFVRTHKRF